MRRIVNDAALDTLFRAARSPQAWLGQPVGDTLLRAIWELAKLGPTTGTSGRARVVFIRSKEARARLSPALPAAQRRAILGAAAIAIVAAAGGPGRRPAEPAEMMPEAAYLILAARALGLDCLPVWRFDRGIVDAGFFSEGAASANFVAALGYGDDARPVPVEPPSLGGEPCRIL